MIRTTTVWHKEYDVVCNCLYVHDVCVLSPLRNAELRCARWKTQPIYSNVSECAESLVRLRSSSSSSSDVINDAILVAGSLSRRVFVSDSLSNPSPCSRVVVAARLSVNNSRPPDVVETTSPTSVSMPAVRQRRRTAWEIEIYTRQVGDRSWWSRCARRPGTVP